MLYIALLAPAREEAKAFAPKAGAEKFTFQAEVNRLMDIIIHSLYSNKVCSGLPSDSSNPSVPVGRMHGVAGTFL